MGHRHLPGRRALLLGGAALALSAIGCGEPPIKVYTREATVACGMCRMGMPSERGCFWAIKLDGKQYTVAGRMPTNHENHAPDGMCNVDRKATVEGTIVGSTFRAQRFDLKPLDDDSIPDAPTFKPADVEGH